MSDPIRARVRLPSGDMRDVSSLSLELLESIEALLELEEPVLMREARQEGAAIVVLERMTPPEGLASAASSARNMALLRCAAQIREAIAEIGQEI